MKTAHLSHSESIHKLREMVENIQVAVMLSNLTTLPIGANPMEVKKVDDQGGIWFLSSLDSDHYTNIVMDKRIQLVFSHPEAMQFLSIYGNAYFHTEKQYLESLYTSSEDQWFEGVDDVELIAIKVEPVSTFYWDKKQNKFVEFIKYLIENNPSNNQDNETKGKMNL